MDGGKNWYAIDIDKKFKNDEVIILGKVDDVYPGLMKNLDGWDKLIKYVKENGPIGRNGIITEKEKDALKDVGLTVVEKDSTK